MKHKIYRHQHKKRLMISWEKYGKMIKDLAKKVEDNFSPDCITSHTYWTP